MSKFRFYILTGGGVCLLLIVLFFVFKPAENILHSMGFSQLIFDRTGKVLRITLSNDEKYRICQNIDECSPLLKEAILLKEDRYFYYHPGINPVSIIRAFYQTYVKKDGKIGGSTITMQVARLKYHLVTKSVFGKLNQIFHALYLEVYYSKDEIFEAYINLAPCGGNIEGFAAASQIYFGKDIIDLSLQEALFLCVLPQNPSSYDPKTKIVEKNLTEARHRLFGLWQKEHPQDKTLAAHMDMPLNMLYYIPFEAPHYTTALLEKYPDEQEIRGTLDMEMQNTVTRITSRYIERKREMGVSNAAVLLVDADNMEILACLGSADFFDDKIQGQVNGTRARRSPGSTLKPFIYALAMDQGMIHPMTMLKDAPVSFSAYAPDNFERDFKGPIKAWEALVSSRNIPAVALASRISNPDLYDFISELGVGGDIRDKEYYGLSLVLGSLELSMEELVSLYGILVNEGAYRDLVDAFDHEPTQQDKNTSVLSPEVCYLIRSILRQNPRPKAAWTSFQMPTKIPVGYKTGTSIGFKDCWSIGIIGHYILAVWIGNFNGYGNPVFIGRQMATPLMFEIIDSIYPELKLDEQDDDMAFPPDNVSSIKVCAVSGQMAQPYCKNQISTFFIPGKSPITKCQICREIYVNAQTGYRTLKQEGKHIKKQVYEFWPTDLLSLFRQAGIPRNVPPPFDPQVTLDMQSVSGIAPEIMSPVPDVEYLLQQGASAYNNLPLKAVTDADVQEVYWFIDQKFIGKSDPQETQYWSLSPGTFLVSVVDDHGRSDNRKVQIGVASN